MIDRKLTVSFGTKDSPAVISQVRSVTWADFAKWLVTEPPIVERKEDKDKRGWYCPVEFNPAYRDSENFVARHALTFDLDHVGIDAWQRVLEAWGGLAFVMYTTWSHTPEAPRFRVVMPLSRPATYDEFQAVVRKVATDIDIELFARESFTPAQMMFSPTRKPDVAFRSHVNDGDWLDVDQVLAEYEDWTNPEQWPHRKDGDGVHKEGSLTPPDEKPGIVGDFCRTFTVAEAIKRFELPYTPTATEGRWTYTNGSRPEGAIEYDGGLKFHSHHDTDPARGQSNAFDLVRLHRFASLDGDADRALSVTERPSYRAMCQLATEQPELRAISAASDFALIGRLDELGPLTEPEKIEHGAEGLARRIRDVLDTPTSPEWLIDDVLERDVIAIIAGPRGSYKSFLALDWSMRVVTEQNEPVYVVSAEGRDFDRRAFAWLQHNRKIEEAIRMPLYVVEKRLDLSTKDGIEVIRQDCVKLGIRPRLFVLDTFSKLSGGLEENDNTAVKQFIGLLDNGLKRAFGATVLLVAHTGHSAQGRARGASALAADTDAEYIVSRNPGHGTISVSRERFKSSPELPPLCYGTQVINWGRVDNKGKPVTSLALVPAAPPEMPKGKRTPTGAQRVALETVEKMSLQGESIAIEDAVPAIVLKTPKPEGRDGRRRQAMRSIEALVQNGWLFLHGEDRVSRIPIQAVKTEEI